MNKERFIYFDYFRAVAILLIILGHSWGQWKAEGMLAEMFANLAFGNTALFVFISGFFFHAVFYKKFVYGIFMKKKTMAILVPYLVMMGLFIFYHFLVMGGTVNFPINLIQNDLIQPWLAALARLLTGHGPMALWYIPFIMIVFVLSPIFLVFIKTNTKLALVITLIFFVIAFLLHRPLMVVNPVHSLFYFIPFYMLGIIYSQHRHHIDSWLAKNGWLLSLSLIIVLTVMYLNEQVGSPTRLNPFEWHGLDWMVPLKIIMIFWLLSLLKKIEHIPLPFLTYIATISFGLFFLHAWPLEFLWITNLASSSFLTVILTFIGVTTASLIGVEIIRYALKSKSKYIIGV